MKKTPKLLPITAVVLTAVAVIFRTFQLLVAVDYSEMGFFASDAGFLPTQGFYILLAAAAVIFIVFAALDRKSKSTAYAVNKDMLTPKQTAVLGIGFLIGACLKLYMLIFNFKGMGLDFFGEAAIFLVFAIIGFMLLGSKKVKTATGFLMLIISISYTLKSAALFMHDTIITRVSGELILLLSYVSAVFFFLSVGRFLSGNEGKGSRYKLLIFAAFSAVLSACASLSGYIAYAIDSEYMKEHMSVHPVSEIGVAVLALIVMFVLYGGKNENDEKKQLD